MALDITLDGSILCVKDTRHSLIRTEIQTWYYDIESWRVSSYGREGDVPDRPMTPEGIAWVEKHYLPKVADQMQPPSPSM